MIYVVINENRHYDVEVDAFHEKDEAIDFARATAKERCHYDEDYDESETEEPDKGGIVFMATYSCEGDQVTVKAVEVR